MPESANLLIVDDERGPLESLRMIFKPHYTVHTAMGGPEAIDLLKRQSIDVVTLDLKMPGMSGIEVMESIKKYDPDIEVIIVTGYSSLDTAIRGLRFRAFDYISKPFDVQEISDIVRRAVAQRRATLRLRQMKEDFLANLSHELRTPLSAIIGYSTILGDELHRLMTPDQRAALDRIHANSHELLRLIEDVLLLNSIEAGELPMTVQPFNVTGIVKRTVEHYAEVIREKGLQIETDFRGDDLILVSDETKVERVIVALLDNAIKFTAAGRVRVATRPEPENSAVEILIADTGIGMDRTQLEQALDGLSQGDESATRRYRGLGLGLRIATRLVQLLGGIIQVRSQPGEGTGVSVRLPCAAPASSHQHLH